MKVEKPQNDPALLVLSTTADEESARKLSSALVEEGLAACVTRVAAASVYRWEGKVESGPECLLLIKTLASNWERLVERLKQLHAYETPELISFEAAKVESAYFSWLLSSCRSSS